MRRQAMLRFSRTAYGRKGHFRAWKFNLYGQAGFPPWSVYWKERIQTRRIKGGFRVSVLVRRFSLQLRVQWLDYESTSHGKEKWLECPKCGNLNKARNFYRRAEPE